MTGRSGTGSTLIGGAVSAVVARAGRMSGPSWFGLRKHCAELGDAV